MPTYPEEWDSEAFPLPGLEDGSFTPEFLEDVFKELDIDRKGHLSRSDLRFLLNQIGEEYDEQDIIEMMKLVDPEATGRVSMEMFLDSFMTPLPVFQNPSTQGQISAAANLPVKRWDAAGDTDNVQSELNRAAEERKKLLDEVLAEGKLKAGEIKKIFARFQQIDKSGKGVIKYPDFLVAMQREDSEASRRLFEWCDKDGSGEINLKEFILGLSQFTESSQEDRVRFTFKLFDSDNSGNIDRPELSKIIKSNAPSSALPQWISRRVDELYDSIGLSRGSKIDLQTFMTLAKRNPDLIAPVVEDQF